MLKNQSSGFLQCLEASLFIARNARRLTFRKFRLVGNMSIDVVALRTILPMVPNLEVLTIHDVAVRAIDTQVCTLGSHHIDRLHFIGTGTMFPNDVLPALASFATIDTLVLDVAVARYNDNEQLFPRSDSLANPSIKLERPLELNVHHLHTWLDVIPLFRPSMLSVTHLQTVKVTADGWYWLGLPTALLWIGVFLRNVGSQLKALELDLYRVLLDFLFSKAPMDGQSCITCARPMAQVSYSIRLRNAQDQLRAFCRPLAMHKSAPLRTSRQHYVSWRRH